MPQVIAEVFLNLFQRFRPVLFIDRRFVGWVLLLILSLLQVLEASKTSRHDDRNGDRATDASLVAHKISHKFQILLALY